MSSGGETSEVVDTAPHQNSMLNAIQVLDEKETVLLEILSELLKCAVCLEIPKQTQVRICEKGHHFCLRCHSKMNICGICRGKLLEGRNFLAEELVRKLDPISGVSKEQPPIQAPTKYTPGSYRCPHFVCSSKMPSHRVLPHLRAKHCQSLIDNVRSSPYSRGFCFGFKVAFDRDTKNTWCAHVSDMGLFTVRANIVGLDFHGWAEVVGDKSLASQFKYQIVVSAVTSLEQYDFGISECDMRSSQEDEGNFFKIKDVNLLDHLQPGDHLTVFFSIWKKSGEKKTGSGSVVFPPKRQELLANDRRTRRNHNRNMRRKRLKEKLRNSVISEERQRTLIQEMSRLSF